MANIDKCKNKASSGAVRSTDTGVGEVARCMEEQNTMPVPGQEEKQAERAALNNNNAIKTARGIIAKSQMSSASSTSNSGEQKEGFFGKLKGKLSGLMKSKSGNSAKQTSKKANCYEDNPEVVKVTSKIGSGMFSGVKKKDSIETLKNALRDMNKPIVSKNVPILSEIDVYKWMMYSFLLADQSPATPPAAATAATPAKPAAAATAKPAPATPPATPATSATPAATPAAAATATSTSPKTSGGKGKATPATAATTPATPATTPATPPAPATGKAATATGKTATPPAPATGKAATTPAATPAAPQTTKAYESFFRYVKFAFVDRKFQINEKEALKNKEEACKKQQPAAPTPAPPSGGFGKKTNSATSPNSKTPSTMTLIAYLDMTYEEMINILKQVKDLKDFQKIKSFSPPPPPLQENEATTICQVLGIKYAEPKQPEKTKTAGGLFSKSDFIWSHYNNQQLQQLQQPDPKLDIIKQTLVEILLSKLNEKETAAAKKKEAANAAAKQKAEKVNAAAKLKAEKANAAAKQKAEKADAAAKQKAEKANPAEQKKADKIGKKQMKDECSEGIETIPISIKLKPIKTSEEKLMIGQIKQKNYDICAYRKDKCQFSSPNTCKPK